MHPKLFEDYDICVQTVEKLLPLLQDTILENLINFSDKSTLHGSVYVHTQIYDIWSSEKQFAYIKIIQKK